MVNGTQISTAIAIKTLHEAEKLLFSADIISALSVEASLSTTDVFKPVTHKLKKHKGQIISATNIFNLLKFFWPGFIS